VSKKPIVKRCRRVSNQNECTGDAEKIRGARTGPDQGTGDEQRRLPLWRDGLRPASRAGRWPCHDCAQSRWPRLRRRPRSARWRESPDSGSRRAALALRPVGSARRIRPVRSRRMPRRHSTLDEMKRRRRTLVIVARSPWPSPREERGGGIPLVRRLVTASQALEIRKGDRHAKLLNPRLATTCEARFVAPVSPATAPRLPSCRANRFSRSRKSQPDWASAAQSPTACASEVSCRTSASRTRSASRLAR
jgi:hypothetical protein